MLTAAEIAAMQDTQETALPDTCTIKSCTLAPDGLGGYTETWTDLASNVACRLTPMADPTEAIVADRFRGRALWTLTLAEGQAISHDDRVVVGSDTYEVAGVREGGNWRTATRVIVARCE